jgi:hypothetical protein
VKKMRVTKRRDSDDANDSDDTDDEDHTDEHDDGSEGDSHEEDGSNADSHDEDNSEVDDTDEESETEGHKLVNGDKQQAGDMPTNAHSAPTGAKEVASTTVITTCEVTAGHGVNTGQEVSLARELVVEQEHITYQNGAIDQKYAYESHQVAPTYVQHAYGEHKIAPKYPQNAYGEYGVASGYPPQARDFVTQVDHFAPEDSGFDHPNIQIRDFGSPNNAPPPIKKLGRFHSFTDSIKSTVSDKEKREKIVHGLQSGLVHVKDALNETGAKDKGTIRSSAVQGQVVETYQYIPVPEHGSKKPSKSGKAASTGMKVGKGVLKVGYEVAKHHPAFASVRLAKGVYDALEHTSAKAGKK